MAAVDITFVRAVVITAAGAAAGFINSIVGSGTLISFPTLVGLGFAGKTANIANGTGLFPGSLSAVVAQKQELAGQKRRIVQLVSASLCGGVIGAILLLRLPGSVFKRVVPFLILFGVLLVVVGPTVQSRVRARNGDAAPGDDQRIGLVLWFFVFLTGIYGGYFGAGQGIILMGILGIGIRDSMARLNAAKNVLAGTVNGVAAVVFVLSKDEILWSVVGLIALGSIVGGQFGSKLGRRMKPNVLRGIIVVIGVSAAVRLLVT